MTWLLDASVLLAREDSDDREHEAALRLLAAPTPLATLDLAYYETANVSIRRWGDLGLSRRLRAGIEALAGDGGVVRVDARLADAATALALEHGITAYDAAYVAAAQSVGARLVSCDVRDLVAKGLAVTPGEAAPATRP